MNQGVDSGLFFQQRIPEKVHRHDFTAKLRVNRICADDRNYKVHQFTIPGDVAVQDYDVSFRVPQVSYVAMVIADCGRHVEAAHPADGTPGGQALKGNVRRIRGSADAAVKSSDFSIPADAHADDSDLPHNQAGYNLAAVDVGDVLYVTVTQVGSTRPGKNLVVSVYLVPVRIPSEGVPE